MSTRIIVFPLVVGDVSRILLIISIEVQNNVLLTTAHFFFPLGVSCKNKIRPIWASICSMCLWCTTINPTLDLVVIAITIVINSPIIGHRMWHVYANLLVVW